MRFNSTKSVYLKKIVTCVAFLCLIYVVVCLIVSVIIENVKIKTMFNNEIKIKYIFKRLTDIVQLFMCRSINIIMINVINKRARSFNVCKTGFINIDSIMISIFIFVVKRSDYELFSKRSFQRTTCMNFINMNDKLFEMILYSLNKKK